MNIGFDAKRLYCNFTGLGNYSRTTLQNLNEFYPENDYFLYTPKVKRSTETDFFLNNKDYHTHIAKGIKQTFWRSFSVVDQLKKDKIDLYHGLSHELPINIHKSGIKSIVTIHDLIFKHYPNTYSKIDSKIYDLKFKYSCQNADQIIAISESTKKDIIKFYDISPNKIQVVYQSCNPLYYDSNPCLNSLDILKKYNLPTRYLLSVGSIEPRKNLKTTIEAYSQLPSDFKIPLVIVGKGKKYKEEIIKLIHKNGLEKLIIWIENLTENKDLKCLYQNAQALIYPSLYEGFGLPIVESLLCKTPVITSNTSSLPEAGGANSLYINPLQIEELSTAIIEVLQNTDLRKKMIAEGHKYAMQYFAPKTVCKQLVNTYK